MPTIYHSILYKYLKSPQIKHWDKEIFSFTQDKTRELEDKIGKEVMTSTLLSNFHLLSNTYQRLLDLEERSLKEMRNLKQTFLVSISIMIY